MSTLRLYILIISLTLILGACSGGSRSEPEMIASYPRQDPQSPQPVSPQPPTAYVYNAALELDVARLERATGKAVDLAYQYRGYLVRSSSWQSDHMQHTTLVLAVPAANFAEAFNALSRLGEVVNQHISEEWASNRPGDGWEVYSEITITLNEQGTVWPRLSGGWNPLRTLSGAWNVFVTIFGFLVDVVIWVAVVVGPFVALAWVLRRVVKRRKPTP